MYVVSKGMTSNSESPSLACEKGIGGLLRNWFSRKTVSVSGGFFTHRIARHDTK